MTADAAESAGYQRCDATLQTVATTAAKGQQWRVDMPDATTQVECRRAG